MRVALVTDWLVSYAGSEKVEELILKIYPQADVYTILYDADAFLGTDFAGHKIEQSFISRFPRARKHYQQYLPFMPLAIEQFDVSSYDLVISSSHAVAKGIITGPDQLHICYCHSPIRYAWDFQHQYLRESGMDKGIKGWVAKWLLHKIRIWDLRTVSGVDYFIANSRYIARRINKFYQRDAKVIYPNVAVNDFEVKEDKEDFYLAASRMVPYKRIDLIVKAFSQMPEKKLVVIGEGSQFEKIKKKITPNVTLMGYQPFEVLKDHMARAKAFVFAAEEDFGIMPIEAQACGTPVLAYGRGGSLETVIDGETGYHFYEQTAVSICAAVARFEENIETFSARKIRQHAEKFSEERFIQEFKSFVSERWDEFVQYRGF